MEGYLAEIRLFAGFFAPRGWMLCEGQLLTIESNSALFSLLGTTYGGDGERTFALPDLRGKAPIQSDHNHPRGAYQRAASAATGGQVPVVGTLALNYIICVEHGMYPQRP
jgi:microcystin-dependent protein